MKQERLRECGHKHILVYQLAWYGVLVSSFKEKQDDGLLTYFGAVGSLWLTTKWYTISSYERGLEWKTAIAKFI
jgi:hypothetical protein